jgi:hypothetical protein
MTEPVLPESLPDLLARDDLVREIGEREGWDDSRWQGWDALRQAIIGHSTNHVDLVYDGRKPETVVGGAAYNSNVSNWEVATVRPDVDSPILQAVGDIKLALDRAAEDARG